MSTLKDKKILIVGGAGFVGSNLTKMILAKHQPKKVVVVDNLLSSERSNIPEESEEFKFVAGSITDDAILQDLKDDIDYVFHLSTFHGNQSSIEDPLRDHENNTHPHDS